MTLPITTSSTSAAGTRARSSAARIAIAPSSGAESVDRAPRYLPIGVRAAPTTTGVRGSLDMARRKLDEGEWREGVGEPEALPTLHSPQSAATAPAWATGLNALVA